MQKTVYFKLIAFILLSVFLTSCSVQKRVYNRGFHIEWREANRKVVEGESIKARKAYKVQHRNYSTIVQQAFNEEKDSSYIPVIHPGFNKQQLPVPTFYQTFSKHGNRSLKNSAMTGTASVLHPKKNTDKNYYEYPDSDVSGGLGGFLTSLIALLVLFGAGSIAWGLLLLLIAIVLCVIGIIQQIDEPDTLDLIFAVLGLCICGFAIFIFMPIISATVLFFIANPGVLLLLLLIMGIYLLMSA